LQLSRKRVCGLALLRAHLASQNCKMKLSRPAPTLSRSKGQHSTAQHSTAQHSTAAAHEIAPGWEGRPGGRAFVHTLLSTCITCCTRNERAFILELLRSSSSSECTTAMDETATR
jgi:hypothetical protein